MITALTTYSVCVCCLQWSFDYRMLLDKKNHYEVLKTWSFPIKVFQIYEAHYIIFIYIIVHTKGYIKTLVRDYVAMNEPVWWTNQSACYSLNWILIYITTCSFTPVQHLAELHSLTNYMFYYSI